MNPKEIILCHQIALVWNLRDTGFSVCTATALRERVAVGPRHPGALFDSRWWREGESLLALAVWGCEQSKGKQV